MSPMRPLWRRNVDAVARIERGEHAGLFDDADHADDRETANHTRMIGPNKAADLGRSAALHGKEPDENGDRKRHHRLLERGRDDLQALDGRYDGERRCDGGIAVEEGRAGDAEKQDDALAALRHRLRERHQGKGAAFAVEVGPQENEDVLERDEQEQRPHDQREDAQHGVGCDDGFAGGGDHGFAKGVDRAGADVAVDDADGAERQRPELAGLRIVCLAPLRATRAASGMEDLLG